MCGVAGIWRIGGEQLEALTAAAEAMTTSIAHRGPDASSVWSDASAGVALGHRRLSIIDLSVHGAQPMMSHDGRFVISYNGELYNFADIRRELEETGALAWRGHSDTEVLVAAISRWGVRATLERANGMFALALWNRQSRTLTLARDRLGEKPLYYGWRGDTLLFASELKALRCHPSWRGEIDRAALALMLRLGYVPTPHSIYKGVHKLPPGTMVELREDGEREPVPTPYWSALEVARDGLAHEFRGSDVEAIEALDVLLCDAVRLRMMSDVPLGAFLSGGVDSSTIVAMMQKVSSRPVRTFTIGFPQPGYDESRHAQAVATALGTDHTTLQISSEDALGVVPQLPGMYDEPFADSSQIPTALVSRLARRHVTVTLSGDGGDELFGGYVRHHYGPRLWRAMSHVPRPLRRALAATLGGRNERIARWLPRDFRESQMGERVLKVLPLLRAGDEEDLYRHLTAQWNDIASPVSGGALGVPALAVHRASASPAGGLAQRMMYWDLVGYLPDDILVKLDRASMAASLEARVPFLDHRVVEFAWRLPVHMKIRDGRGKWIVREVLARYMPASLVNRPKMGFAVPLGEWLRGPLRAWADALLDPSRLMREGYLDAKEISGRWIAHRSGRSDHHRALWNILVFQAWLEAQDS